MNVGETKESQIWGRRLLLILLVVFGIIVAMNVMLITMARGTFSGVTIGNAYEQGLAYNATLAEKHRQDKLGWQAVRVKEGFPQVLAYMVAGKDGGPLVGATVTAFLKRPVGQEADVPVLLGETAPGVYKGAAAWPGMGRWDIETVVVKGGDMFSMHERVVVR